MAAASLSLISVLGLAAAGIVLGDSTAVNAAEGKDARPSQLRVRIETADGVFGGRSFVETLVANDRFQPLGNPLIATDTISFSDLESVFLPPQPTALDLTLRDDDASILSDETLPLNPPPLDALELARAGVSGGFFRIGLISGPITSLSLEAPAVPEPIALVVFVIGLLIVRRMVGRVSSTGS